METANKTLEQLDFSVRLYNVLKRAGYNYVSELKGLTTDEIKKIRNMSTSMANELTRLLTEV